MATVYKVASKGHEDSYHRPRSTILSYLFEEQTTPRAKSSIFNLLFSSLHGPIHHCLTMATTTIVPPPTYVAGDSPPSYEEVANKVNQLVGSDPTPQKYLDVATSLSEEERKVLSDGAEANNPIKTEDDKRKLSLGAAKTMSREDTVAKMQEDASAASAAVVAIDGSFTALQVKIAEIDQLEQTNFLVQLNENKSVCMACPSTPSFLFLRSFCQGTCVVNYLC